MLNKSQQSAKTEITKWLSRPEPELVLSSPGGYGKSFLIDNIIEDMPHFNKRRKLLGLNPIKDKFLTATTNKAAAVLSNGQTVNKLFGLIPITDWGTGNTYLKAKDNTKVIRDSLIIIDECSAASRDLINLVQQMSQDCKILYSGDHCQLLPVNEKTSPVFDAGHRQLQLTEPMRQDPNSDLFKLCQQLREIVETGIWTPIEEGEGITLADAPQTEKVFNDWFTPEMKPHEAKAITYTNKRSIALNRYVRGICGFGVDMEAGDVVSVRNYCFDIMGKTTTKIEEIHIIHEFGDIVQDYKGLAYRNVTLSNGVTYRIAEDPVRLQEAIKLTAKSKDWQTCYFLKENFIDLRSAYSCTSHVSQGSTYDKVFVDLANLGTCRDPKVLARLLYVAVSRSKKEVVFNGRLPKKYGG